MPSSGKFDFLRAISNDLAESGADAELFLEQGKPDASLKETRQLGEDLARLIEEKHGAAPAGIQMGSDDDKQVARLARLRNGDLVSEYEFVLFTRIRKDGNKVSHRRVGDHGMARDRLEDAYRLALSVHARLGASTAPPPRPSRGPDIAPSRASPPPATASAQTHRTVDRPSPASVAAAPSSPQRPASPVASQAAAPAAPARGGSGGVLTLLAIVGALIAIVVFMPPPQQSTPPPRAAAPVVPRPPPSPPPAPAHRPTPPAPVPPPQTPRPVPPAPAPPPFAQPPAAPVPSGPDRILCILPQTERMMTLADCRAARGVPYR